MINLNEKEVNDFQEFGEHLSLSGRHQEATKFLWAVKQMRIGAAEYYRLMAIWRDWLVFNELPARDDKRVSDDDHA